MTDLLTRIWCIHKKQLPINLEVRSEEHSRHHGPGSCLVWVQDGLLGDSIGQEEYHHDQEEVQHIHGL